MACTCGSPDCPERHGITLRPVPNSNPLTALCSERDELLAALKDMAQMRWFVMAYDGAVFDKPRMIAMLDRADVAIAEAERGRKSGDGSTPRREE